MLEHTYVEDGGGVGIPVPKTQDPGVEQQNVSVGGITPPVDPAWARTRVDGVRLRVVPKRVLVRLTLASPGITLGVMVHTKR